MKIIGIVGSPRRKGHTATLVEAVLRGAQAQGAETEMLCLGDYDIGGCLGCSACKQGDACVQGDDMHVIYRALESCQGLVLGSPIYLDHITAQTKAVLDRMYAYLGPQLESRFPQGIQGVICLTWEAANPHAYSDVGEWLSGRLRYYFGIETIDILTAEATDGVPVSRRPELLERAREIGAKLAQSASA
jgi:multimeric flavodoxin WrbA